MRQTLSLVLSLVSVFLETSLVRAAEAPNLPEGVYSRYFRRLPLRGKKGSALSKRNLAGIETIGYSKSGYDALVTVGSWNYQLALDTASSDLWLVSSDCKTDQCKGIPNYPSTGSPTFASVNDNQTIFSLPFLDGTLVRGTVSREMISLANLTILDQAFALVNSSNASLPLDVSGGLGLGFPRLSQIASSVDKGNPFFVNLAQRGNLTYPLFGVHLTNDSHGTISFGAIDADVVKNHTQIEWHPVQPFPAPTGSISNTTSPYLQWALRLSSLFVNGTNIPITPTYSNSAQNHSLALFDIGTDGIYGPYQDVEQIFTLIDGSRLAGEGQWAIPCDLAVPITFAFGGTNFTLLPSDLLVGRLEGSPNLCLSYPFALPPSADGIDWQLGGSFLRSVYSIFSYGIDLKEPPMIGFYSLRSANQTAQSPPEISSYLSAASATIPITLPNTLIPTPTFLTPSYQFSGSVTPTLGQIVSTGLATSTYVPLIKTSRARPSSTIPPALPTIALPNYLMTLVVTASGGGVVTSTFASEPTSSVILGVPRGSHSSSASKLHPFLGMSSADLLIRVVGSLVIILLL